jgi:hypothetical protein
MLIAKLAGRPLLHRAEQAACTRILDEQRLLWACELRNAQRTLRLPPPVQVPLAPRSGSYNANGHSQAKLQKHQPANNSSLSMVRVT